MPRQARIDIPGLLQHVIVRGVEKRPIFLDDQDRDNFLSRLRFLLPETETDCYAWALLDNHFHLLLRPKRWRLSDIMRRLLTGYAIAFNLRHGRVGHLFQNRYRSIVCDQDPYLLELVRYIHLNPVRAGVVADLEALATFPWCGHRELLGLTPVPMIRVEEVLSLFASGRRVAQQSYAVFMADGVLGRPLSNLSSGGKRASTMFNPSVAEDAGFDERVLGGGRFVEQVLGTPGSHSAPALSLAELMQNVATRFQVTLASLGQPGKERNIVRAKAVICHVATRLLGIKGVEVAAKLGYTSATVSQAAKRGETLLASDDSLQGLLDKATKL